MLDLVDVAVKELGNVAGIPVGFERGVFDATNKKTGIAGALERAHGYIFDEGCQRSLKISCYGESQFHQLEKSATRKQPSSSSRKNRRTWRPSW